MLFQDEATLSTLPTFTRMWAKVGQQPQIKTPGVRAEKQQVFGVVDPVSGEFDYLFHPRRNQQGFRRQLGQLARRYHLAQHPRRKIYLVLDNGSCHKDRWVQQLLAKHHYRIELVFLPAYGQELNAIERLWRHMRRIVTHTHYFEHLDALLGAAREFFAQMQAAPRTLLSIIGYTA